eukprot:3467499-Rhodomonas_salina.4
MPPRGVVCPPPPRGVDEAPRGLRGISLRGLLSEPDDGCAACLQRAQRVTRHTHGHQTAPAMPLGLGKQTGK